MKIKINNYARQEIAKFIMDGVSPMPHPEEFSKAIDGLYNSSFDSLIQIINYCGYLGYCYEKDKEPDLSFEQVSSLLPNENYPSVWINFLESEGVFLEFKGSQIESAEGGAVRYEDVLSYAFGEMGLLPWQFYRMTMAEYALSCNGYHFKRWRPDEHNRAVVYTLTKAFNDNKKNPLGSVQSFMPLPTDKKNHKYLDQQEIKNMWAIAKNM
jgi:hypothetical protein